MNVVNLFRRTGAPSMENPGATSTLEDKAAKTKVSQVALFSILQWNNRNKLLLFLEDDPVLIKKLRRKGFSRQIFPSGEWPVFKRFCNSKNITEDHLDILFKKYLGDPQAYDREFQVKLTDARRPFVKHSRLHQDLGDTFMPLIFFKEFPGLTHIFKKAEASFSRFMIMSYIFCMEPLFDLFVDFLAALRRNMSLKLKAVMYAYSFESLLRVLTEEIDRSYALKIFLESCNPQNATERHFRRIVFGDKFWDGRHQLKSRFPEAISTMGSKLGNREEFDPVFCTEKAATRETACAIIADISSTTYERQSSAPGSDEISNGRRSASPGMREKKSSATGFYVVSDDISMKYPEVISESCFTRLKNLLGYRDALGIIRESELPLALSVEKSPLLQQSVAPPSYEESLQDLEIVKVDDEGSEAHFVYNSHTGASHWKAGIFDMQAGTRLRDIFDMAPPGYLSQPLQHRTTQYDDD